MTHKQYQSNSIQNKTGIQTFLMLVILNVAAVDVALLGRHYI